MTAATFIAAITILCILIVGLFVVLWRLVRSIFSGARQHMLDQLNAYDLDAASRLDEYEDLSKEIEELQAQKEALEDALNAPEDLVAPRVVVSPPANYQVEGFGETYAQMKQAFNFDKAKILNSIVDLIRNDGPTRRRAVVSKMFLEALDTDTMFELSLLSPQKQYQALWESLEDAERKLLESYVKDNGWEDAFVFKMWLEKERFNSEGVATVRVGSNDNIDWIPDDLREQIKVERVDSLYDGMQVMLQGKMYDFGVQARDLR